MSSNRDKRRQKKRKQRERRNRRARSERRAEGRSLPAPTGSDGWGVEWEPREWESRVPFDYEYERAERRKARAIERSLAAESGREPDADELEADERRERAQGLAFEALECDDPADARHFAREALDADPACCDALLVLAGHESLPSDRVELMTLALASETLRLGGRAFFEENAGSFWELVWTRPYMRLRFALASQLRATGLLKEAAENFEALLRLAPIDEQGAGIALACVRLELGDAKGAAEHLAREDGRAALVRWARVLQRWLVGDLDGARRALEPARARNALVERELLSERPPSSENAADASLDEYAAAALRPILRPSWAAHPQALAWLASVGSAPTGVGGGS